MKYAFTTEGSFNIRILQCDWKLNFDTFIDLVSNNIISKKKNQKISSSDISFHHLDIKIWRKWLRWYRLSLYRRKLMVIQAFFKFSLLNQLYLWVFFSGGVTA